MDQVSSLLLAYPGGNLMRQRKKQRKSNLKASDNLIADGESVSDVSQSSPKEAGNISTGHEYVQNVSSGQDFMQNVGSGYDYNDNEYMRGTGNDMSGNDLKPKRRSQYSVVFKMHAIQKYYQFVREGKTNELQASVAKHFDINQSSVCRWIRQRKEIEAAYQTAEQDRMRVTSTFKKRSSQFGDEQPLQSYQMQGEMISYPASSSSVPTYSYMSPMIDGTGGTYVSYVNQAIPSQVQETLQLNSSDYVVSEEPGGEHSTHQS